MVTMISQMVRGMNPISWSSAVSDTVRQWHSGIRHRNSRRSFGDSSTGAEWSARRTYADRYRESITGEPGITEK
jgi:hypothetical protein